MFIQVWHLNKLLNDTVNELFDANYLRVRKRHRVRFGAKDLFLDESWHCKRLLDSNASVNYLIHTSFYLFDFLNNILNGDYFLFDAFYFLNFALNFCNNICQNFFMALNFQNLNLSIYYFGLDNVVLLYCRNLMADWNLDDSCTYCLDWNNFFAHYIKSNWNFLRYYDLLLARHHYWLLLPKRNYFFNDTFERNLFNYLNNLLLANLLDLDDRFLYLVADNLLFYAFDRFFNLNINVNWLDYLDFFFLEDRTLDYFLTLLYYFNTNDLRHDFLNNLWNLDTFLNYPRNHYYFFTYFLYLVDDRNLTKDFHDLLNFSIHCSDNLHNIFDWNKLLSYAFNYLRLVDNMINDFLDLFNSILTYNYRFFHTNFFVYYLLNGLDAWLNDRLNLNLQSFFNAWNFNNTVDNDFFFFPQIYWLLYTNLDLFDFLMADNLLFLNRNLNNLLNDFGALDYDLFDCWTFNDSFLNLNQWDDFLSNDFDWYISYFNVIFDITTLNIFCLFDQLLNDFFHLNNLGDFNSNFYYSVYITVNGTRHFSCFQAGYNDLFFALHNLWLGHITYFFFVNINYLGLRRGAFFKHNFLDNNLFGNLFNHLYNLLYNFWNLDYFFYVGGNFNKLLNNQGLAFWHFERNIYNVLKDFVFFNLNTFLHYLFNFHNLRNLDHFLHNFFNNFLNLDDFVIDFVDLKDVLNAYDVS